MKRQRSEQYLNIHRDTLWQDVQRVNDKSQLVKKQEK